MKIVVCIKQVPDTNEVKLDPVTNTLIRDGVPSIINHDDKSGIEAALQLKEKLGGTVTVVCMGPPQADVALREALAMGCDDAILISGREFGGSDTYATSNIIAAGLKKIGYDLVITGRQAIDGDTAQVGPEIAEFMDLPQITYTKELKIEGDSVIVTRYTETGDYLLKAKMPVLLTAIKELNNPRYPSFTGIFAAYDKEDKVMVLSNAELDVDLTQIGVKNSPTNVYKSFVPVKEKHNEIINGINDKEKAANLVNVLADLKLI